jgi:hypothetical protein
MEMDNNNFRYLLQDKFKIEMIEGKLFIDDIEYEKLDDDPTYTFAIVLASMINKFKDLM